MPFLKLFLGTAMLTMGRKLYWLFLGIVGFIFASDLIEHVIHGQPHNIKIVFALLAGLIGAALAVFLQKFAVMAGGFFAGGYLLTALMKELGMTTAPYRWLVFVAGGFIGALLMRVLFGWTLIILSSVVGSVLILQALHFSTQLTRPLFIFLLVLGIAIQYGLIGRKSP
jgi:hypothetical protein